MYCHACFFLNAIFSFPCSWWFPPAESGTAIWRWFCSPTWYLLPMDLAGWPPQVWVSWGCSESSSNFIHERVARLIFEDIAWKPYYFEELAAANHTSKIVIDFPEKPSLWGGGALATANSNHNLLNNINPLLWLVLGKTRHIFESWGGANRLIPNIIWNWWWFDIWYP